MKKGKIVAEEALQIAVKRKEAKGKEEKERYTHLNAKFQRRARDIESPFKQTMQRNTGKQQNGKD